MMWRAARALPRPSRFLSSLCGDVHVSRSLFSRRHISAPAQTPSGLSSLYVTQTVIQASGVLLAAAVPPAGVAAFATGLAASEEPPLDFTCRRCTIADISGEVAEHLSDVLLSFGAQAVTVQEHRAPGAPEQQIYADAGMDQLWDSCDVVAHFALEHDIPETMVIASDVLLDILAEGDEEGATQRSAMPLNYTIIDVPNTAWVDQVKASYVPLRISESLYIIPEWSQPPDLNAINIILQPGVAFGTGEHPTTRLCLHFVEQHIPRLVAAASASGGAGVSVMDYGTGSGVLAIAALLLGAGSAAGTDVDPLAVRAARRNAELSGVAERITVVACLAGADAPEPLAEAGLAAGQLFDVCVANILRGPLVELAPRLAAYVRPGGLLALSGVLDVQAEDVCTAYSGEFKDFNVRTESGWALVTAIKK